MTESTKYRQYCPIAIAAEVLTERWTPLVLRSFFCGATRFNEIQGSVPRMSSALLSRRLKQLEHNGIIERVPAETGQGFEYHLTDAGYELFPVLDQMNTWALKWLRRDVTATENQDADFFMWEIRRIAIASGRRVKKRKVIKFQLDGVPIKNRFYWLVLEPKDTDSMDVCVRDPGYDVDLWVRASLKTLIEIRIGERSMSRAVDEGSLTLEGDSVEANAFARWFMKGVKSFRPPEQ